jgi:pSer/pThr/pTyr-binding forkhead associated (FHA) protein
VSTGFGEESLDLATPWNKMTDAAMPPPPSLPSKGAVQGEMADAAMPPPPSLPKKAVESETATTGKKTLGAEMPPPPSLPSKKAEPPQLNKTDAPAPSPAPLAVYERPEWSGAPSREDFPYTIEVLKTGTIIDTVDVAGREAFIIGRLAEICDYTLEHPSISRQHAVIQFKADGAAYIFDASTHGTRINKRQLKPRVYAKLGVGDVIQLGQSSRLLIFQGPEELMQTREGGWGYKTRPDETSKLPVDEMEAAKAKALALKLQRDKEKREGLDAQSDGMHKLLERQKEGASWGFGDDASSEEEEETSDAVSEARRLRDEGKLNEKQQQLLDKLEKRLTKIMNLKEEIRRIKVSSLKKKKYLGT